MSLPLLLLACTTAPTEPATAVVTPPPTSLPEETGDTGDTDVPTDTGSIVEDACATVPADAFDVWPSTPGNPFTADATWDGERLWVVAAGTTGVELIAIGCDGLPTGPQLSLESQFSFRPGVVAQSGRILVTWHVSATNAGHLAVVDATTGTVLSTDGLGDTGTIPAMRYPRAAPLSDGFLVVGLGGSLSNPVLQTRELDLDGLLVDSELPTTPMLAGGAFPVVGARPPDHTRIAMVAIPGIFSIDSVTGPTLGGNTSAPVSLSDDGVVLGWVTGSESNFQLSDGSFRTMTGFVPQSAVLDGGVLLGAHGTQDNEPIRIEWWADGASSGVPIPLEDIDAEVDEWAISPLGPNQAFAVWAEAAGGYRTRGQFIDLRP